MLSFKKGGTGVTQHKKFKNAPDNEKQNFIMKAKENSTPGNFYLIRLPEIFPMYYAYLH